VGEEETARDGVAVEGGADFLEDFVPFPVML